MLILTRRVGETLMVGDDVTVTILGVREGKVKVGIHAPRNIPVHRSEIYKRIKIERAQCATTKSATAECEPEIVAPACESLK